MGGKRKQRRGAWLAAFGIAVAFVALAHSLAVAQNCNPVIDGTYCAEQMRSGGGSGRSAITMNPIQDLGRSISGTPTSPATLGGISVRGGSTCIGLLRRGACN